MPNAVRLEAARAYIEWTAERIDGGEPDLATEGAVAKYVATEAGNKAAEDAIQALGGYGYTREYMVEKIKRDVRITTIYEGTSEIMEWTIARDRWQLHLKTGGLLPRLGGAPRRHQRRDAARRSAAQALRSLAALLERCRLDRLTRNQHVLFRLGELIAWAETAAIFAERAASKPSTRAPLRARRPRARWRASTPARPLLKVACDGLRWAIGAGQTDPNLAQRLGLDSAFAAQAGLIEDMDFLARELARAFPAGVTGDRRSHERPDRARRRHRRARRHPARRPERPRLLEEHLGEAVLHLRGLARALEPGRLLRPRPVRPRQDLQQDRRLGPRLPVRLEAVSHPAAGRRGDGRGAAVGRDDRRRGARRLRLAEASARHRADRRRPRRRRWGASCTTSPTLPRLLPRVAQGAARE